MNTRKLLNGILKSLNAGAPVGVLRGMTSTAPKLSPQQVPAELLVMAQRASDREAKRAF